MSALNAFEAAKATAREAADAQQQKTFTRWWNSWLPPELAADDLCEDVRSGVRPIRLLEALSGTLAGRYNKAPRNAYQKLENQQSFLVQLKSKGIRLENIGPEDLAAGQRKLVLGLTWTLILRYEIQKYGADELQLLRWVDSHLSAAPYGLGARSWSSGFNDGRAFAALICQFGAAGENDADGGASGDSGGGAALSYEALCALPAEERKLIEFTAQCSPNLGFAVIL